MNIEPSSNNRIFITTNNGICLSISDDGCFVSIQRYHAANRTQSSITMKGTHYKYNEHFNDNPDSKFEADVVRIEE